MPDSRETDIRDINFLILHSLLNGPCRRSALFLMEEMQEKKLLPSQYDWKGNISHPRYFELAKKHGDLSPHFLHEMLLNSSFKESFPYKSLLSLGSGMESVNNTEEARSETTLRLLQEREIKGVRKSTESWPAQELYRNFRKIKTLRGHCAPIYCAKYDRESRLIVSGSDDNLLKIWSAETAYLKFTLRGHARDITDIAFHPENTMLISASNDGTLRAWNMQTGAPIAVLNGHKKDVLCVVFSPCPDRPYVLSGGADGTCRLWNSDDFSIGSVNIELPLGKIKRSRARHHAPGDSSNGGGPSTTPAQESNTFGTNVNGTHSTVSGSPMMSIEVLCVSFNTGGTRFVIGGTDCAAHVFQILPRNPPKKPTVKHLATLRGHSGFLYQAEFSHLGDKICTGCKDGTARIWRRARCEDTSLPRSGPGRLKKLTSTWTSFVLDMKRPATSSVNSFPDARAATSSTVPRARRNYGKESVDAVAWTLDDQRVVTSSSDYKIRVWNAENGELLKILDLHKNQIFVLDPHPSDKRILLSGSYDGACALWDIEAGTLLSKYSSGNQSDHDESDNQVIVGGSWAPNGLSFTVSDLSGCLYLYSIGEGDLTALAPRDQFFMKDYAQLLRDRQGKVLDGQLRIPPHLIPRGPVCDADLVPHPPELQPPHLQSRPGCFPMESNARSASTVRAELIARAEEYRRREVEEENRLAREAYAYARERAKAEAIRKARREREKLEKGSSSRNRSINSPEEETERIMQSLDSYVEPEASDSEPDDPEWTGEGEMRITRSIARSSENQGRVNTGENRLRRIRPHPDRDSGDGADSQTETPGFNPLQHRIIDGDARVDQTGNTSQPGLYSFRRSRQSLRVSDNLDMDSESATIPRALQPLEAGAPAQNSVASQGSRVDHTSSIVFQRDDGRSFVATESVARSEVAEARRGHIVGGDGAVSDQNSRRAFSSRSGSDSPTSAKLEDQNTAKQTRKRQRRIVNQDDGDSPRGSGLVEENDGIQSDKNARLSTISKRSYRRSDRCSVSNGGIGRVSLGTEIGSWRLRPADVVERKRNTLPDPLPDGEVIPLSASAWLHSTVSNDDEYVPQVKDRIVYFPQGHHSLIEAGVENGMWNPDAANTSIPVSNDGQPMRFEVVRIEYLITQRICTVDNERKQEVWDNVRNVARLFLNRLDGMKIGEEDLFYLNYYPIDSVPEYAVLESRVQSALARDWRIGDRFKMKFIDEYKTGVYYNGRIVSISEEMQSRPWNSIEVQWESEGDPDRGAKMLVSPWELLPINPDEKPIPVPEQIRRVRELSNSIVSAARHQIDANDAFRARISSFLEPVEELAKKRGYTNIVPCPLTMITWLGRLKNHFYRHEAAIMADLDLLLANSIAYSLHDRDRAANMEELVRQLIQLVDDCRQKMVRTNATSVETTKSAEGAGGYNACVSTTDHVKSHTRPSSSPSTNQDSLSAMPPPSEVPTVPPNENSTLSGAAAESTISYGGTKTTAVGAGESGDEIFGPG